MVSSLSLSKVPCSESWGPFANQGKLAMGRKKEHPARPRGGEAAISGPEDWVPTPVCRFS